MPAPPLAARTAYRRWYAAAGPWAGFFRAVPLVAVARGAPVPPPAVARRRRARPSAGPLAGTPPAGAQHPRSESPEMVTTLPPAGGAGAGSAAPGGIGDAAPVVRELLAAGTAESWLGRPDVLLLLDLPGATTVATVAALAPHGVRPVLLIFLWPEPGALVPSADLVTALLAHAPPPPPRRVTPQPPAQHAFVLARERATPATVADLAVRFDNRYDLGAIDLPSAERLRDAAVRGVVACRLAHQSPAPDLTDYLHGLEAAQVPVRRLVLAAST